MAGTIFRVQKTENYVTVNNTVLRDKRLSWKAKGILVYMLSMPNDWVFYLDELITHATDGRDSFYSGMKELKKYGYVERKSVRDKNQRFVGYETFVYEVPKTENPYLDSVLNGEKEQKKRKTRKQTKSSKTSANIEAPSVEGRSEVQNVYGKQAENPYVENPYTENPYTENPYTENPYTENPTLLSIDLNKVFNKQDVEVDVTRAREQEPATNVNAYKLYELNFGLVPYSIGQDIFLWVDDFKGDEEIVKLAITKAVENGKQWAYAKAILRNWFNVGIETVEQVELYEQRENVQNGKYTKAKQNRAATTNTKGATAEHGKGGVFERNGF